MCSEYENFQSFLREKRSSNVVGTRRRIENGHFEILLRKSCIPYNFQNRGTKPNHPLPFSLSSLLFLSSMVYAWTNECEVRFIRLKLVLHAASCGEPIGIESEQMFCSNSHLPIRSTYTCRRVGASTCSHPAVNRCRTERHKAKVTIIDRSLGKKKK